MDLFKQQRVEDFYEIGEELGRYRHAFSISTRLFLDGEISVRICICLELNVMSDGGMFYVN